MVIFHSYVKLPEGTWTCKYVRWKDINFSHDWHLWLGGLHLSSFWRCLMPSEDQKCRTHPLHAWPVLSESGDRGFAWEDCWNYPQQGGFHGCDPLQTDQQNSISTSWCWCSFPNSVSFGISAQTGSVRLPVLVLGGSRKFRAGSGSSGWFRRFGVMFGVVLPDIRFHHFGWEIPPWTGVATWVASPMRGLHTWIDPGLRWGDPGDPGNSCAWWLVQTWAAAATRPMTGFLWSLAACTWRLLFFRPSTVAASLPSSYCPPAGHQRFTWMRDGHGSVTELSADGAWRS